MRGDSGEFGLLLLFGLFVLRWVRGRGEGKEVIE